MRFLNKIFRYVLCLLIVPGVYIIGSLLLTSITVNKTDDNVSLVNTIYLNTNGIHLDIVIPVHQIDEKLITGLNVEEEARYLSFGWGDENFYLNTPTWGDLTFKNAFGALFFKSNTLIHLTKYFQKHSNWVAVNVTKEQLTHLNYYLLNSFKLDGRGEKIILKDKGYSFNDEFYKAKGSYSCLKTCNSWVNSAFKTSGLKSCYWTPFDFELINKYE
ncbi:TIGR02117 family protein [Flavivirga spongiicola]|uniref:TIGR02117 family protein n=1 Tax=Flavivirga spongiicola TaxID=421621 RepID=A0ABU7XVE7_9FLAO|nr:TIGR02117 family protein [Flavivirga sp. MEBiC05379]MDO5979749.1 TIGR02117 family protein [Flavivirga sp. MEBiC05379]